jgi:hypothetical protein
MKKLNHTGLLLQDSLWASLRAKGVTTNDLDKLN